MTLSPSTLSEIDAALKEYCKAVLGSDLSAASQGIYIDHATNFVRWTHGQFDPGSRVNAFPVKRRKPDPVSHTPSL